jgi:hypothetical protein
MFVTFESPAERIVKPAIRGNGDFPDSQQTARDGA